MTDDAEGEHDGEAPVTVGPWLRHTRRVAYQNPWLTLYHDEVSRPDGSPGVYGVVHFANLAVGVVALDKDDRVALVAQHRYTLDARSLEIPEGGVPPTEAPLDGARRELQEETGVTAAEWREIARVHISNSVTDELALLYLATDLRHGPTALEGTEQDLTLEWRPFEEALAMTMDGRITDALTVVALQRVAIERAASANAGASR